MFSVPGKGESMDTAAGDLDRRAESGNCEAQLALARRYETEHRTALARGWYARAAKQGSVAGLRALAINLLTMPPIVARDGVNMIRSAAHKGDAEAAYVCAMLAAQDHLLDNRWEVARECLMHAAERGWEPARLQLEFLGDDFAATKAALVTAALPIRGVFDTPRIGVIESFAPEEFCDWLIERARPDIAQALVYDSVDGGGRVEAARSNSSAVFNLAQSDMVLMLLRARIAASADLRSPHLEDPAILHYAPGQKFESHFDFLDPDAPGHVADLGSLGQRVATFLLYLNEGYEGGETTFPRLDWRYKGRKGDALLFWNVTAEGRPDEGSLHAGLPPLFGEKWLLSQWIRQPPT
jgi:prolyl 4-hydroxylase